MMNPLFTIAIPSFKQRYLSEAIDSCLSQSYRNFEIVIVNDASPEDLDSVISKYDDVRIRYFCNSKNCGAVNVVDNWNICLSYAKGKYIICMGDDDKLLPSCLEEYEKLITKYPGLGVYHAWTQIINEESEITSIVDPRPEYESVYSFMLSRWNGRGQYIGDFLFEREELLNNGGFYKLPLAWTSDDISVYIAAKKRGIANMQVPGFQYRINTQTISKNGNVDIKLQAISRFYEWTVHFLEDIPEPKSTDYIFWKMLVRQLNNMIFKYKIYILSTEITDNLFNAIKFFLSFKKYNLSLKIVLCASLIAFRNKLRNSLD